MPCLMLWLKAFHIMFMVTWFSGLFYLPRLYVYHTLSRDAIGIERFKVMERKLLFGITYPGGIITTLLGIALIHLNASYYMHARWMQLKLLLVVVLWLYHLYLNRLWWLFKHDRNPHGHVYYRWLNEFPVLILALTVILAIVKPF